MAQEVKYDRNHPAGATPEARIANRLRNSGGEEADHIIQKGSGPTRAFTNIHHPGSARKHGEVNRGEGNINGQPYTDRRKEAEDNDY